MNLLVWCLDCVNSYTNDSIKKLSTHCNVICVGNHFINLKSFRFFNLISNLLYIQLLKLYFYFDSYFIFCNCFVILDNNYIVIKSFVGGKSFVIGNFVNVGGGMTSLLQQNDRRICLFVGIT